MKPRDISDEELRSIMGETAAKALIDEVNTAEDLDTVAETDQNPESPTVEELLRDFDTSKIDAELADLTDNSQEK